MSGALTTTECGRMKEFVDYFNAMDSLGIPTGIGDMIAKARELGLKPPAEIFSKPTATH